MERYYFTIRYLPAHADHALLAGRCIANFHGFINANPTVKHKMGVTFPQWNDSSVGCVIGFVGGSRNDLVGLSYQLYFSRMKAEGIFEISDVLPVPEGVPEVRFVRNQTIGKIFVASKKRRIERSMKRSEERGEARLPEPSEHREFDFFHRIPITSSEFGDEFILHIQKSTEVDAISDGFNSYGLGTNSRWRGSVPDLVFDPFFDEVFK